MNFEVWIPAAIAGLSGALSLGVFIGSVRGNTKARERTERAIDEKFKKVDERFSSAERELHKVSTIVTAMAAQDPAVLQRLTAAEQEITRLRDRQHTAENHVTTLHAKTDINARDVAEVRGALFGTHPKPGSGGAAASGAL